MNHDESIRRLATVTDERAARTVSPEARAELAEQIMATAPGRRAPARRGRVLLIGVPLAAAAAVAAAIAIPARSHPHRTDVRLAALSFTPQGKYLVVKVVDPYADPKRYAKEFAAHGMRIQLKLVPASPSIVGTVVAMGGGDDLGKIQTITAKGRCWSGGGGADCEVGVKVPIGFHGQADIVFGRAARTGEQYVSTAESAFAPGEALYCVDVRHRTVDEALAGLKRAHVSVAGFHYEPRPGYGDITSDRSKIPGNWYVSTADPWSAGKVLLWVQPQKPRHAEDDAYYKQMMKGCRH